MTAPPLSPPPPTSSFYIGLMSGTSLDGVDGVVAEFSATDQLLRTVASAYVPFTEGLRQELLSLQASSPDELHREALAAIKLAECYAQCVAQLLAKSQLRPSDIRAIGAHGQTIRHRPELGYTRQTFAPASLAEHTGIDVVADFRSRDIAAGGQGAPLVPAFHQAVFGSSRETRVVANIGGISNISVLGADGSVLGFDTGPGNVLLDWWMHRHMHKHFDEDGAWAASGKLVPALLHALTNEAYFTLPPPKSTGRDLFHPTWLSSKLTFASDAAPADVQKTLVRLTTHTLSEAIAAHAPQASAVYVCGGGAFNRFLMQDLQAELAERTHPARVQSTAALGIPPNHVEGLAFAWLACRHVQRQPGNLPAVTGARGTRILGALYPA